VAVPSRRMVWNWPHN